MSLSIEQSYEKESEESWRVHLEGQETDLSGTSTGVTNRRTPTSSVVAPVPTPMYAIRSFRKAVVGPVSMLIKRARTSRPVFVQMLNPSRTVPGTIFPRSRQKALTHPLIQQHLSRCRAALPKSYRQESFSHLSTSPQETLVSDSNNIFEHQRLREMRHETLSDVLRKQRVEHPNHQEEMQLGIPQPHSLGTSTVPFVPTKNQQVTRKNSQCDWGHCRRDQKQELKPFFRQRKQGPTHRYKLPALETLSCDPTGLTDCPSKSIPSQTRCISSRV